MTLFINSDALAAKDLPVPQTFDELLVTAKAVKTNGMSGIAMRARASGNSSPAAMGFVFSYGGAMVKDNRVVFDSPEAIAAIEMYGQLLGQAGPAGVGTYDWYQVLNDFLQGGRQWRSTAATLRQTFPIQQKAASPSRPALQPFHISPVAPRPLHVALAGVHQFQVAKQEGGFPVPAVGDEQADLAANCRSGLATTRVSAWSSEGFRRAFGPQAAAAALTNLQNGDVDLAKAILFHPQSR